MKKLTSVLGVFLMAAMLCSFNTSSNELAREIKWVTTAYDFGEVKQGEPVTKKFYFTNNGNEAIQIIKAKASCGCTVTDFSQNSIAVGEEGFVSAEYNALKLGSFHKTVQVFTNVSEEPIKLEIKGVVK
jgi:hypothetical protein